MLETADSHLSSLSRAGEMRSDTLAFLGSLVKLEATREAVWAVFAYAIRIDSFAVQQCEQKHTKLQIPASYSPVC